MSIDYFKIHVTTALLPSVFDMDNFELIRFLVVK